MKSLAIVCAALAAGLVGTANAADVSNSTLDAMGFGNATIMSDADGLEIRGKGTSASVWGTSRATYWDRNGVSSASNGYNASSNHYHGSALAKGNSDSFAGHVVESSKSFGPFTTSRFYSNLIVSGGSGFAFAK